MKGVAMTGLLAKLKGTDASQAPPGKPARDDNLVPPEEIRFGVILNGGVSLAVWMGGAVLELDRLIKARSDIEAHTRHHELSPIYRKLLTLAGCRARADVIAGTSAGGINGAALGLAQVNAAAQMSSLRDIWVDSGRIETLLRQPFRGAPTSLLRGDEFFLPQVNAALARLAEPNDLVSREKAPVDLSITTTVLGGNQVVTVDSMGQRLPQRVHAGRFNWRRMPEMDDTTDPFAPSSIGRTADRLALASRSTSSFPIAFEPSFVPVNSPQSQTGSSGERSKLPLSEEDRLHPDMTGVVQDWGNGDKTLDHSRFVVDGGLLANTPTKAALRAVDAMPAGSPVRRVMLLVYPHAEPPSSDPPADQTKPPTVIGAVGGLMDALTAQGSRTFVDELDDHNKIAAGRRGTRGDIVCLYDDPAELERLTENVFKQYRQIRLWRAARDLSDRMKTLPPEWNNERARRAAESAQKSWDAPGHPVPYVPERPPAGTPAIAPARWEWGVTTALGITEAAADLLRRLVWVLPVSPEYTRVQAARERVSELGRQLRARRSRQRDDWGDDPLLSSLEPNETYWRLRLAVEARAMLGTADDEAALEALFGDVVEKSAGDSGVTVTMLHDRLIEGSVRGQAGREVAAAVEEVITEVGSVLGVLGGRRAGRGIASDEQLVKWRDLLCPGGTAVTRPEVLLRLLRLEIAATALGDEVRTGLNLPLEVVQLSAQTVNAFAQFTLTGNDKLGGMSVNRFGGFLKRSWRVNDWTWGRIDAATTLCRIVLQPARVRRAAELSHYLKEDSDAEALATATITEIVDELFDPARQADARIADLRAKAHAELTRVFDPKMSVDDLDSSMPALADLFAWAVHLECVPEEMPALARAIRADEVEGANRRSRGALFLKENKSLLRQLERRGPAQPGDTTRDAENWHALGAFDRGGIGGEPLAEEGTSDQMIRTATTAAAVIATVADSDRSGLGPAKVVTRPLRGVTLLPYWVITGLSSRSVLGRSLALLGLALGGALLSLSLFGVLPKLLTGPAVALGAGAVLAAFGFGAMRSGTILHGLVLITPIVPLVAYATERAQQAARAARVLQEAQRTQAGVAPPTDFTALQGIGVLTAVLALIGGLMVLGSLPATTGSVFGALDRLSYRQRLPRRWRWYVRRPLAIVILVLRQVPLAAGAALVTLAVLWVMKRRWHEATTDWCVDHLGLLAVVAGAAVLLGSVIAFVLGRQLQVLRPTLVSDPGSESSTVWGFMPLAHPAGATAGWSVVYGTAYLGLAWLLLLQPGWLPSLWARALLITAAGLGVTLVVVVPLWLPVRAIMNLFAAELARGMAPTAQTRATEPEEGRERRAIVRDMTARGVSYRVFMTEPDPDAAEPEDRDVPRLQRLGRVLHRRLVKQEKERAEK